MEKRSNHDDCRPLERNFWFLSVSRCFCVFLLFSSLPLGAELETDEMRVALGLPILSFNREKTFETKSYTAPFGVSAEIIGFVDQNFGVGGGAVLSMTPEATVMMGGTVSAYWFYKGGASTRHEDLYFEANAIPNFSLYGFAGFGGRSFDFTSFDKAEDAEKKSVITLPDPKSGAQGFFIGPVFGAGGELPLFGYTVGGKFQMIMSLPSQTSPGISGFEIILYTTFKI